MDLSRRSFLLGGAASLVGAGAFMATGCNHKIGDKETGNTDAIKTAMVDYFKTFDFIGTVNPTVAAVSWHIFEGLYNINPLTNDIYPALANGEPKKVDDLTYEITIRDNAKFSNDAQVMAGDVVNSFKIAKNKDSVNYMLDFIDSIKPDGKNKVIFHLNKPMDGVLKSRLSLVQIFPASASITDMEKNPIGSGPYMVTAIDGSTGGFVDFTPNPNYNGVLSMPKNRMVWNINSDKESRSGALKGGAVYVCEDLPLSRVYDARDAGASVEFSEGFECCLFFFNTRKEPLNNKEIRQVLLYAIDKQKIIDEKLDGHGDFADCFLSSANKDYHPASINYKYDPEKAKELLAKNNVTTLHINIVFDKNCWAYSFKDLIVQSLEEVGIQCNVIEQEFRWTDTEKKLAELDYDVCFSTVDRSFHGGNADILLNFVYFPPGNIDKITGYPSSKDNKFDLLKELTDKAAGTANDSERQKIYNSIFDILAEEAFYYPLIHREQVTGYYPEKVSGFKPISSGGLYLMGSTLA